MTTGGSSRQTYPFFKVRTERFKQDQSKYVVRCGIKHCDTPLTNCDLIFTTFNQTGDDRHYHIQCYKDTNNFKRNNWPSSTKQIEKYNELNLEDRYKIQDILFPQIKPYKYQLFALFDSTTTDAYTLNRYGIQNLLRERDIEVFVQNENNKWKPGEFTRNSGYGRLQTFYDHPECKKKHQFLVEGYIRFYICMDGPVVLKHLIQSFSKIYFRCNSKLYNVP